MNTAKELRLKFEKDLLRLQNNCKHANISDWMEHYWAIGHSSCMQVKICLTCDKIIEEYSTLPEFETTYSQSSDWHLYDKIKNKK